MQTIPIHKLRVLFGKKIMELNDKLRDRDLDSYRSEDLLELQALERKSSLDALTQGMDKSQNKYKYVDEVI